MEINWQTGFTIHVREARDAIVISANREGLLSLADILTALAEEPAGTHIHLDEYNSLEDGSLELILERNEDGIGNDTPAD